MSVMKLTREDFDRACSLLPESTVWGDHLTPEVALHIAIAALESAEKEAVPVAWFYYEDGEFIRMYDSEEKAESAREKFGGDYEAVYTHPAPASKDAIRREALERDAARWRIIEETIPADDLHDIAVIVAHEAGAFVGNALLRTPADLIDSALSQQQSGK